MEFIISSNLSVENVGCESTFVTRSRRELLDISLSNGPMTGLILQWRVSSEPFMSDHRIIIGVGFYIYKGSRSARMRIAPLALVGREEGNRWVIIIIKKKR